jgi:hypothetical protein
LQSLRKIPPEVEGREWLVALARIHYLHPELFAEIASKAEETYREQIEDESELLQRVRNLTDPEMVVVDLPRETVEAALERREKEDD